jgi:site-specific DNA recombinase
MKRSRSAAAPPAERAGLYVRVSLDRSAHGLQEEILSPETQEDRARQYCGAQGWAVAAVERDIDESGYRQHYSHRAGLMRLLEAVQRGELTKIVVWKFSRLSRRLKEFIEICDRVEAAGAGVVSVTEQVDTSTPAGRLIRNILASFAQFQSEEISEQIFESWLTKARRGERPPGFAPFGTINRRGMLEPDPATHGHLLAIYRTFRETGSVRAVWDYLASQGVPPPRAGEWSLTTLRGILTNPVYVGQLDWAGERFQARWEPIVPPELWQAVQETFAARRSGGPDPGRTPTRRDARLLTGLIRCGLCGRPLWTRYAKGASGKLRRVYWCCSPTSQRRGCPLPAVAAEEAEAVVWEAVVLLLEAGGVREAWAGAVARTGTGPGGGRGGDHGGGVQSRERRLAQLQAEVERLERTSATLVDLLADGSIGREQFQRQNRRYQERLEAARAELGAGPEACETVAHATQAVPALSLDLRSLDEADRRRVLLALDLAVSVEPGRIDLAALGLSVRLPARRLGETLHFGAAYQRLDYRGALLTDKQAQFIRRTYDRADKVRLAERLGRSYPALVRLAGRLRTGATREAGRSGQAGSP